MGFRILFDEVSLVSYFESRRPNAPPTSRPGHAAPRLSPSLFFFEPTHIQAEQQQEQEIAAHEKQIRDLQAVFLGSRKSSSAANKAFREEAARASARAAETAAGLSSTGEGVSAARVREGSRDCSAGYRVERGGVGGKVERSKNTPGI